MAYGLLAKTDPIVGIYTAFFPVAIYIIMGTSAHISIGTSPKSNNFLVVERTNQKGHIFSPIKFSS